VWHRRTRRWAFPSVSSALSVVSFCSSPDPRLSALIRGKVMFLLFRSRAILTLLCVPSCPLWLRVCSSISAIFGNHGNFGNLLQPSAYVPSARYPPPIGVLLKTKAKVQFDRTVTERSKPFFSHFCQPNRCHFAGLFTLVTLCRLVDRQWVVECFSFTKLPNYPFTQFCWNPTETLQSRAFFHFSNSVLETNTLRRCQSIALRNQRIKHEPVQPLTSRICPTEDHRKWCKQYLPQI